MRLGHVICQGGSYRERTYSELIACLDPFSEAYRRTMKQGYKHNHYVPEWYQKRFLPAGQHRQWYLDLRPERVTSNGRSYTRRALLHWGPAKCFAQDDLYTTKWGSIENRDIERFFFGQLDNSAPAAVAHFADFEFNSESGDAFNTLLPYMSVQKLRTPKGLGWLRSVLGSTSKNRTLVEMQRIQNIFCNIWGEAVWQIADASKSPTKFIISDHPVVAYNRECFPASKWCSGYDDPDIRMVATHTYFPLSPDKILILTNLAWVRDPYQNAQKLRPNPKYFRPAALFNMMDIQHYRYLSEEEVVEVNYVTKRSAFRYIVSPVKEWLFPERRLRSTHWRKLGDGYLFMPDPRHIHGGGTTFVGFEGGGSDGWDAYGRKPWQEGYEDKKLEEHEWRTMEKFKAEWAAEMGPCYRGVELDYGDREIRWSMGDDYHRSECERDKKYLGLPGRKHGGDV